MIGGRFLARAEAGNGGWGTEGKLRRTGGELDVPLSLRLRRLLGVGVRSPLVLRVRERILSIAVGREHGVELHPVL